MRYRILYQPFPPCQCFPILISVSRFDSAINQQLICKPAKFLQGTICFELAESFEIRKMTRDKLRPALIYIERKTIETEV